jgi:hypothetical protein
VIVSVRKMTVSHGDNGLITLIFVDTVFYSKFVFV